MFKRANKITALLVAAASVMSIVPAMAADNTRVGNKAGTVKQGVAFEGGKYAYYGYRGDADTGIWYNNGGDEKDTADSDLADYRFNNDSKYGEKYAYAQENSNDDEYLVDLSTGKIVTDETAEEKADSAQAKLTSNIKKADRYKEIITQTADLTGDFDQILKGQFGEVWYQYTKTNTPAVNANTTYQKIFTTGLSAAIPQAKEAKSDAELAAAIGAATTADVEANSAKTKTAATLAAALIDPANVAKSIPAVVPTPVDLAQAKALLTAEAAKTQTAETKANIVILKAYVADFEAAAVVTKTAATLATATAANNTTVVADNTAAGITHVSDNKYSISINGKDVTFAATGAVITGYSTPKQSDVDTAVLNYVKGLTSVKAVFTDVKVDATNVVATTKVTTAIDAAKLTAVTTDLGAVFTDQNTQSFGTITPDAVVNTLLTGFSNASGKYIDASYNANIKVYSTLKGRAIVVDEYDKEVADAAVSVHLKSIEAIAQDKEFIYTYTTVDVKDSYNNTVTEQNFIQKISKAQGSKDADEAYVPKSIDSYQVDNKTIYDNDDMNDAYAVIHGTKDSDFVNLIGVEAKDNTLYVTRAQDDKVKVYKLSLKSVKSDIILAGAALKEDVDTNAVVLSGDKDTDIIEHKTSDAATAEDQGLKGIENVVDRTTNNNITLFGEDVMRHPSVSIDVEGNVWALDEGQIKKITGLDVKNVNTCDRAMDAIDAYDDSSVIAWDISGDAYTTLKEGTKVTEAESTAVAPVIVTGWVQDGANWSFNDTTGAKVTSKWINVGGNWYYLKADGVMATGWYQDGATWYYLQSSGAMATGWLNDNGTWYYLAGSGAMLSNTTVDGYKLGATGAWVK